MVVVEMRVHYSHRYGHHYHHHHPYHPGFGYCPVGLAAIIIIVIIVALIIIAFTLLLFIVTNVFCTSMFIIIIILYFMVVASRYILPGTSRRSRDPLTCGFRSSEKVCWVECLCGFIVMF